MIFKINDDKFVLDSFHLYWLYKAVGYYLKDKNDFIDPWKLIQFVYERPLEIENTPAAVHVIRFYTNLFEEIKHGYTIYDIILAFMFYQLPFRKINEKKGRNFDFCRYIIDKTKRILSDEQTIVDQRMLDKYVQETRKPVEEFTTIRKSGTNIFYELIKNNYLNEGIYIKNYVNIPEKNNNQNLSLDYLLFKKSMKKINSIYLKQKES